ncbi:hypothetical protein SHKM778_59960 [Streptomyces sp. KM77-8]|uniref:Secreted protein n=1 Tax=Streptomyces haneummycinicus TaxID=3074435 RepID=A0AAT9HPW5_9ACTN
MRGARGHAGRLPARLRQLLLQRAAFLVQPLAVPHPGGGPDGGLAPGGDPESVLVLRAAQPFPRVVQDGGRLAGPRVAPLQLVRLAGELLGGVSPASALAAASASRTAPSRRSDSARRSSAR